jgi:hypothetical protein
MTSRPMSDFMTRRDQGPLCDRRCGEQLAGAPPAAFDTSDSTLWTVETFVRSHCECRDSLQRLTFNIPYSRRKAPRAPGPPSALRGVQARKQLLPATPAQVEAGKAEVAQTRATESFLLSVSCLYRDSPAMRASEDDGRPRHHAPAPLRGEEGRAPSPSWRACARKVSRARLDHSRRRTLRRAEAEVASAFLGGEDVTGN